MKVNRRKSYHDEFYNLQNFRSKPIKGILVYEDAQRKLDIGDNGKLYRQKFYNYLPIIGPITAIVYGNLVLGKTKCLRYKDMIKFENLNKIINLFAFLVWPIILFMFMTLLSYLSIDFANPASFDTGPIFALKPMHIEVGHNGDYNNLWHQVLVNQLSSISINSAGDFFTYLSVLFSGLLYIFVFPFITTSAYLIANTLVGTNIIYILCILVLTIINPVNIFNSILLNSSNLRFITVYEASGVYRYRSM